MNAAGAGVVAGLLLAGRTLAAPAPVEWLRLPEGFRATVFAAPVPGARSLAVGARGTVFVGSRGSGRVYALVDADGDGRADEILTLARGLDEPNGVAFHGGALYIAAHRRILRLDDIESRLHDPPHPVVVYAGLPPERHHGRRYIRFGPDGHLYLSIGAPCNVCRAPGHGLIVRLGRRGEGPPQVYARGVRNSVGFDWRPGTGVLWFTDNGRDWLGDERPPDELNRAPLPGRHFGFPYCHGAAIADPRYGGPEHPCQAYTPPARELGPHVAALGMRFYTATAFPPAYRGAVFIAEHGSWNRSRKIGYRVTMVRPDVAGPGGYRVFASGWLRADRVRGRPVDVAVTADGALLVSDDYAGAVYRIEYAPPDIPRAEAPERAPGRHTCRPGAYPAPFREGRSEVPERAHEGVFERPDHELLGGLVHVAPQQAERQRDDEDRSRHRRPREGGRPHHDQIGDHGAGGRLAAARVRPVGGRHAGQPDSGQGQHQGQSIAENLFLQQMHSGKPPVWAIGGRPGSLPPRFAAGPGPHPTGGHGPGGPMRDHRYRRRGAPIL